MVKNLADVETLGATSAINTDKTGTPTMNQMMVSTIYANGNWFTVEGDGYRKSGAILSVAGVQVPDFTRLAYGLALDTDATVSDSGDVVGDPTEAALVVLAAKLGVDAEETRRAYPRLAEAAVRLATTSSWRRSIGLRSTASSGCPRWSREGRTSSLPVARMRRTTWRRADRLDQAGNIEAANERLAEKGLRVLPSRLACSTTVYVRHGMPIRCPGAGRWLFVGMVGIIEPLRAEERTPVEVALAWRHRCANDHRWPRRDRRRDRSKSLGFGPGAISGRTAGRDR